MAAKLKIKPGRKIVVTKKDSPYFGQIGFVSAILEGIDKDTWWAKVLFDDLGKDFFNLATEVRPYGKDTLINSHENSAPSKNQKNIFSR